MRLSLLTIALLLAAPASHAASNCDTIRAGIDAKVRASGVTDFTLSVVDADAKVDTKVDGKVVGSCDRGSKRIVYSRSAAPAASQPTGKASDELIVTECKDGSVSLGGDCRK
jgi:chitodextrinase